VSNIEWTDESWNPVIGCRHVAEGCRNCYAETMSKRLAAMGQAQYAKVIDDAGKFNGKAIPQPQQLDKPLRWRKPRRVFVNSMSDLFHEDLPFEYVAAVYGVMAACPQHTFQVLTKRPERMREFFEWAAREDSIGGGINAFTTQALGHRAVEVRLSRGLTEEDEEAAEFSDHPCMQFIFNPPELPLKNVWHGISAANQADADKYIPILLQVPSAVRFVSLEPLVGPVDVGPYLETATHSVMRCEECGYTGSGSLWHEQNHGDDRDIVCPACSGIVSADDLPGLDWVIVGGESGPGARPCDIEWIRSIVRQCKAARVPCFVKQLGANVLNHDYVRGKNANPASWPEDIRVREFPEVTRG